MSFMHKIMDWLNSPMPMPRILLLPGAIDLETEKYAEEKKPTVEEALTRLVIMDMETFPSHWTKERDIIHNYDFFENNEASIKVKINNLLYSRPDEFCLIEDIEVGKENRQRIIQAFQNRKAAEVIERLLDRVQGITTVNVEDVLREERPKLVEPFKAEPIEVLHKHVEALKEAVRLAKTLPPPPKKLNYIPTTGRSKLIAKNITSAKTTEASKIQLQELYIKTSEEYKPNA